MMLDSEGSSPNADDDLAALRKLDQAWDELERLVRGCIGRNGVGEEDEKRFRDVVGEAQVLYGRVSDIVGHAIVQVFGQQRDVILQILATESITGLFLPIPHTDLWCEWWAGGRSAIRQAIGRIEAERSRRGVHLAPEAIVRWQGLIGGLERTRVALARIVGWLTERPGFLNRSLERLEGSPVYRFARIVTTFGAFIMLAIVVLGIVAVVVGGLLGLS